MDPFGPVQRKALLTRLGIPLLAAWLLGALIAGVAQSSTTKGIALGVPALLTALVAALLVWALRQAKKARNVAGILSRVETPEDRKAALAELDQSYKKKDPAAIFARAQLLMQEDPKKALEALEQIQLDRVMAPVADEARAQRAMIHLLLGEVSPARQLADGIGLERHQDAKTRAMLASVVSEAWARSGNAKKATDTLGLFDPEDEELVQVKPQMYRALAYASAHTGDTRSMKRALRRLMEQDVRLLGSFLTKKAHPLLQKEAKRLYEQSGQAPRQMKIQRM